MIWLSILIGITIALVVWLRLKKNPEQGDTEIPSNENCQEKGCGVSCFCDDNARQRAVRTKIEYYDDEELDAYAGMSAESYTDEQVEEFNEVLTTLQPKEVADWLRSLELRGIALPESLKDEAFMLMNEENEEK